MLKSVDVLIGLAVVMLYLSAAVTLATQFFNDLFNQRGLFLKDGIAKLLRLIDPTRITLQQAKDAAGDLLRDPSIASRWFGVLPIRRVANEVHREELTALILAYAGGGRPSQVALKDALAAGGIADPAGTLESVRMTALELERSNPELSNSARQSQAILVHAPAPFVGKLNAWFDQTIDRVSDRFTAVTRFVTVLAAIAVALLLQVDSVALVNRLSTDNDTRARLVEHAMATDLKPGQTPDQEWNKKLRAAAGTDLVPIPDEIDWPLDEAWPGIILTVLLLSLGAPFWYELLKSLLKLRSLVAAKDDDEREARQTTQPAGSAGGVPARTAGPANALAGERGDVNAVG
jgi:hypothetical protein